jgi:hypothetical protein
MYRRTAALTAAAVLVPAAAAQAGTVTLNKACFVKRVETMVVTGSGFAPGTDLTLTGDGVYTTVTTDGNGAFQTGIPAPDNGIGDDVATARSIVGVTLNVENPADPSQNASVSYKVSNFAVDSGTGAKSPHTKRTWHFVGFPAGQTVYGHFLFKRHLRGTQRFGKTGGPCGTLTAHAPGLPRKVAARNGVWTVQFDTAARYSAATRPAWIGRFPIYLRYRR